MRCDRRVPQGQFVWDILFTRESTRPMTRPRRGAAPAALQAESVPQLRPLLRMRCQARRRETARTREFCGNKFFVASPARKEVVSALSLMGFHLARRRLFRRLE